MNRQQAFDQAVQHHEAGRPAEAESLYREILASDPNHADALHLLGVLAGQQGRIDEAIDRIRRALAIQPSSALYLGNLGSLLVSAGRTNEAIDALRQVAALRPDHADAHFQLAGALLQAGQVEQAAECWRRAIRLRPDWADAWNNLGHALRRGGRAEEAVAALRRAVELRPEFPEAWNNLGAALHVTGRSDEAIASYQHALAARPDFAEARFNLGVALHRSGRLAEAAAEFQTAIRLRPDDAESHHALGNVFRQIGEIEPAIAAYRRSIEIQPNRFETHNNLGNLLLESGHAQEAIDALRRAVALRPDLPEPRFNLANALQSDGRLDEAIEEYRRALSLRPNSAEAMNNLGNALRAKGNLDEAAAAYRRAAELAPNDPEAHNNIGLHLLNERQIEPAMAEFRKALELNPRFAEALVNLGNALKETGRLDEAFHCHERALAIRPNASAAGNLLYSMHFHPDFGPEEIFRRHAEWNRTYVRPLAREIQSHSNTPDPERRVRIGCVSPDFRDHPVGRFLVPLLTHHDRERFEIVCYVGNSRVDEITKRLRAGADAWKPTIGLPDAKLAEMIRRDRIDILVDLTMHLEGSRLLTFARKPAPVQVTYLAYAGTTGVETIDWRLTDRYLDSPGGDDSFYIEKSFRLRSYWCYVPPPQAPEVSPPPMRTAGYVTFGCLNNYSKVSAPALAAWMRLLRRVQNSRLILHAHEGSHRETARRQFSEAGLDPDRLEFVGFLPMENYLGTFGRIDIALDPFPYPGGTTSCDAAWMGVPVVTLSGRTAVSRGGVSVLSQLQLTDLIATNVEEYIDVATRLAGDSSRLASLRAGLRERMRASPLMNESGFAADVENAFREMWRQWCRDRSRSAGPPSETA